MRYRIGFVLFALALGAAPAALAQEAEGSPPPSNDTGETEVAPPGTMLAPKNALEIGVEGGYTQPLGEISQNVNMLDIAKAGGAVGLDIAYRLAPMLSLGAYGTYSQNVANVDNLGDHSQVRGLAAGIQAGIHFLPFNWIDPYVNVGTGYRLMWESPSVGFNQLNHGFEPIKGQVGVDYRVSKDVALGPMIGADLNVFVWNRSEQDGVNNEIPNKSVNTYLFAGLSGKFDLGGERVAAYKVVQPTPAAAAPVAREVKPEPVPEAVPAAPEEPVLSTGVSIEDSILAQCHMAHPKAFFEFDKSNLSACDLTTINDLAACFATGPLAGKKLEIVGHADPRGSDDYNLKLGESRAESVANYLEREGVPDANVTTTSKGKREATGVDENGWAYDRRVEIHLAK
jgi:outer membrane protein OmpA-like peptidoglycan-associated protein/outer membrane protein W